MSNTTASTHTGGALWDIGAQMAGLKPVWGVEYDPNKVKWAMRNIPDFTVLCSDVATVDYSRLPKVYHLHSSPRCTNASVANANSEEAAEDIASAEAICLAIEAVRPRTFTLENVWPYRNFEAFQMIVRKLRELAYCVDWWHLNSADYGVPQTRKRLILIASRDRQPRRPQPTHSETPDMFGLYKPWVGWYEAIEDLLPDLPDTKLARWQVERLPEEWVGSIKIEPTEMRDNGIQLEQGQPVCTIKASRHTNFRALLIERDSKVTNRLKTSQAMSSTTQDNFYKALLIDGKLNANSTSLTTRNGGEPMFTATTSHNNRDLRAVLIGDQQRQITNGKRPASTVRANDTDGSSPRAFDGFRIVKLTPRALARFQSVPDTYLLPTNNKLAGEIIGNGVPCLFSKAICEAL